MTAFRAWLKRILSAGAVNMSTARREWVRAAIAEIQALPESESAFGWCAGAVAMILRDLAEQALLPWRREEGRPPPARFVAAASLALLLLPFFWVAVAAPTPGWMAASLAASAIAAWMNVGAVVRTIPLGGLLYVVSLRLLPLNLLLLACAGGVAGILVTHASPFY